MLLIIMSPNILFAQEQGGGLIPCDGTDCSFNHLITLMVNIFNELVKLGIVFSSIAFAYAGFLYITSSGDPGKVSRATKIFTNFAIGLFLLLGAFLLIQLILNSLGLDSAFSKGVINLGSN